jgi:hypothetical protein
MDDGIFWFDCVDNELIFDWKLFPFVEATLTDDFCLLKAADEPKAAD